MNHLFAHHFDQTSSERPIARQHLEQNHSYRVKISSVIDRLGLPLGLFRRHIIPRTNNHPLCQSGVGGRNRLSSQPEIHDDRLVLFVEHYVFGLQVAMNDPLLMRRLQRAKNLQDNPNRFVRFPLSSQPLHVLFEVFPFDVLQGDEAYSVDLAGVVDFADQRMIHFRRRFGFDLHSLQQLGRTRRRNPTSNAR